MLIIIEVLFFDLNAYKYVHPLKNNRMIHEIKNIYGPCTSYGIGMEREKKKNVNQYGMNDLEL